MRFLTSKAGSGADDPEPDLNKRTMKEIKVLDKLTIDKIAAGEVVERPSSVVKELLENAIDAGATALSVEIRDGGINLIRVTDNGSGIDADQIRNAFLRHSTSKITDASDLSFIRTLGFRGEALSSIAAVSRLELCTKTKDSLTGVIYKIEGGKEVSFEEAGLPDGTTILVNDLFYNTPARLKFLKSPQTEAGYVTSIVEKIALSHPEITVKYTVNGQVKLSTKGSGSLKDTVYGVFGRDITNALIEVEAQDELLSVRGFIGDPRISRGTRNLENYFINGRYVKDRVVAAAIEEAYKGHLMKGSFPFTDLYIFMEPELLDVNVHPSKMEIRFFDNEKVFHSLSALLKYALEMKERIPTFTPGKETHKEETPKRKTAPEPFETRRAEQKRDAEKEAAFLKSVFEVKEENRYGRPVSEGASNSFKPEMIREASEVEAGQETVREAAETEPEAASGNLETGEQLSFPVREFLSEQARPLHRIAGCVFDTYWIVEYENEMYIIDQHAAHEKVLYERIMARIREGSHASQNLSPALIVTLTPAEENVLTKYQDALSKVGFTVEHFGGSEYALSAVPADLYTMNEQELFLSFLDEAASFSASPSSELLESRIATAACKAAVKGGNKLSVQEADALIGELLTLENPYNCPHGRPTIIKMSKYELEKKFKRVL